jgi:hypothetical protein
MDSDIVAKLSFTGRAEHPCGGDFLAAPFLTLHAQFAWRKPILHDMKAGQWTAFTADEKLPIVVAKNQMYELRSVLTAHPAITL